MKKKATWTKLRSGAWGIRVTGDAKLGEVVEVVKSDGTSQNRTVGKVVHSGNGVTICEVIASAPPSASRYNRREDEGWRGNGCIACRRKGDWCNSCAFDEFDN